MNDRPPDQATGQAATHTIADAARPLGVSENAVRKRIQRGKLTGHKTDSGWIVVWIEPDIRPDTVQTPVPEPSTVVDDLRDQVAYLRDQLAQEREARAEVEQRHAAEIERRDVLLREALERIPQLPATVPTPAPPPTQQEVQPTRGVSTVRDWRWWPFDGPPWRRRKI